MVGAVGGGGFEARPQLSAKKVQVFLCFHSIQNLSKRENTHKKKFIWVYHPPKNLYLWPQLGEGGRGRHFVVGTTQKYKFFFLTSPLTLSAWPKNQSFTEGCLKHIFHLKFLLQIEQKDNFPFNEMDYQHGDAYTGATGGRGWTQGGNRKWGLDELDLVIELLWLEVDYWRCLCVLASL